MKPLDPFADGFSAQWVFWDIDIDIVSYFTFLKVSSLVGTSKMTEAYPKQHKKQKVICNS